jgi:hypothetical protein
VTRELPASVEQSGIHVTVPTSGLLSSWSTRDWSDGIHVANLSPLERLVIRTANSTYEIVVLCPATGSVLVRGGAFFPVFMPARLAGSSLGGSFLKLRSIHVGFRLELNTDRGFIITSSVRSAAIAPAADHADIM